MHLQGRVTAVMVNYKTLHLAKAAYTSFRKHYPGVPLIAVDNGSADESAGYVKGLNGNNTRVMMHAKNIGHGPAMHLAINMISTEYVFTLDSDSEVLTGSFLQEMVARLDANDNLYALGWLRWVDRCSGVPLSWFVDSPPKSPQFVPYVHPYAGMYRRAMYVQMRPFQHHGAPCLNNMIDAQAKGLATEGYDLAGHVKHWTAGTRRMYAGRWDLRDGEQPGPWKSNQNFPI